MKFGTRRGEGEGVTVADGDATMDDIEPGRAYIGQVNNTVEYGAFVNLTPERATDLTGLIHHSAFPDGATLRALSRGDFVVVEPIPPVSGQLAFQYVRDREEDDPRPPLLNESWQAQEVAGSVSRSAAADGEGPSVAPQKRGTASTGVVPSVEEAAEMLYSLSEEGYMLTEYQAESEGDEVRISLGLKQDNHD